MWKLRSKTGASLLPKLSAHFETNRSLLDCVSAQAEYVNLEQKLYSPQDGTLSSFGLEAAARLFFPNHRKHSRGQAEFAPLKDRSLTLGDPG